MGTNAAFIVNGRLSISAMVEARLDGAAISQLVQDLIVAQVPAPIVEDEHEIQPVVEDEHEIQHVVEDEENVSFFHTILFYVTHQIGKGQRQSCVSKVPVPAAPQK